MNSKLDLIFKRRSVRQYEERTIPDKVLGDILKAAMAAPSACAKDPWHFIVVKDWKMLEAIAEGLPNGKMLGKANAGIVVCGDIEKAHDKQLSYLLQDCSASIENLLLAANALGIGACWLGVHPREERGEHISKLLGIPDSVVPVSVISLGYPAEEKEARTRYSESAVHYEKW